MFEGTCDVSGSESGTPIATMFTTSSSFYPEKVSLFPICSNIHVEMLGNNLATKR